MESVRFCKGSHSYTKYKTLKQGCWRHILCDVCAMLDKGKERWHWIVWFLSL